MKRRPSLRQLRRRAAARREIAKGFGLALFGLAIAAILLASPFIAEAAAKRFPVPYNHSQAAR